jgi:hypothetical protein
VRKNRDRHKDNRGRNTIVKKFWIAIPLLALLAGCATQMTAQGLDQMKGRSLGVAVHESGGLQTQTGGKVALFGAFSSIAASAQGHRILTENNVPDPAVGVAGELAKRLALRHQMRLSGEAPVLNIKTTVPKTVARLVPGADLVLVTQTAFMSTIYHLTDMNNYKVTIVIRANLIDAAKGTEIASGSCNYSPKYENTNDAPSWKELFDDGAAGFKEQVKNAESYCTEKFATEIFSL